MGARTGFLETFWLGMAVHLWQTTLVLSVLLLLGLALRRAPARWSNLLWWIALAKLFLPLSIFGPWVERLAGPLLGRLSESGRTFAFVEHVSVFLNPPGLADPVQGTAHWATGPAYAALTGVWLSVFGWLLLRWAVRSSRVRREVRLPLDRAPAHLLEKLLGALEGTTVPAGSVRLGSSPVIPAVAGLFSPRILISERVVDALSTEELRAVLIHEDAHRRRRDPLLSSLLRLTLALFFFYPPIWWIARRLRDSSEQACDEQVLTRGVRPSAYSRALARALGLGLRPLSVPAAVGLGNPARLSVRLERVRHSWRYTMKPEHRLTVIVAAAVVIATSCLPLDLLEAGQAEPETPHRTGVAAATVLERLEVDIPVLMNFQDVALGEILASLETTTRVRIEVIGSSADAPVTVDYPRMPLKEALTRLAVEHGLAYEVVSGDHLVVHAPWLAGKDGVTSPRVVHKVQPVYPEEARKAKIQGRVMLQAVVREDGSVDSVEVLRETEPGHGLGESAVQAVSQWKYEPATLDGKPVDVYFTIVVEYRLD